MDVKAAFCDHIMEPELFNCLCTALSFEQARAAEVTSDLHSNAFQKEREHTGSGAATFLEINSYTQIHNTV